MPIRPENRARYPKLWPLMVAEARERSGGRCECDGRCGLIHEGGRCDALNGRPHPRTGSIVVLTLAHEHGVPLEETSIVRMFHACQQCHNKYDAPMRAAGVKARKEAERRRVLEVAGQLAFAAECATGRKVAR
jgi:hypothetical protein